MIRETAVILLNWNSPDHTLSCIGSLLDHCDQDTFDIIVADNGSSDDSVNIIRQAYPKITLLENGENLGFAEGNNIPLRHSINKGYTYSVLLNNDTLVDQDIISLMRRYLQGQSAACAVQPAIYYMHEPQKLWNGAMQFSRILGYTYSGRESTGKASAVDWVTGCCFMVRNEALEISGLFNKNFFLYYEDVDLSFRLRKNAFELHYLPSCRVFHEAGASGKQKTRANEGVLSPVIHYYLSRNHIWFLRLHGQPLLFPLYAIIHLPYYFSLLIYFVIRKRWKKAGYLLRGLRDGILIRKNKIRAA